MVTHTFDSRQRQGELCRGQDGLVYKISSKTARTITKRDPVYKQTINKASNEEDTSVPLM